MFTVVVFLIKEATSASVDTMLLCVVFLYLNETQLLYHRGARFGCT
jgi:hypothetical protein